MNKILILMKGKIKYSSIDFVHFFINLDFLFFRNHLADLRKKFLKSDRKYISNYFQCFDSRVVLNWKQNEWKEFFIVICIDHFRLKQKILMNLLYVTPMSFVILFVGKLFSLFLAITLLNY